MKSVYLFLLFGFNASGVGAGTVLRLLVLCFPHTAHRAHAYSACASWPELWSWRRIFQCLKNILIHCFNPFTFLTEYGNVADIEYCGTARSVKESWRHSAKQCRFARYVSCKWSVPLQQCRPREEALTEFEIKTILAITTSTSTSAPIPRQTAAPVTTLGYGQFVGKNGGVCDFCKFINIYIIVYYCMLFFDYIL